MTVTDLLILWDIATEDYDDAMDYADIKLVFSIERYLNMLAEEIECFWRQM